ncbi:DNA-directed RNA polymerase subunit alpha [Candidatus Parcubacteria bacterium]|nr:DNA-directed RNA polymerase subunit alpha [Candidatus Parcubacteria bacterium]
MISLPMPSKVAKKEGNKALFEIQGLYPGYGVTVGNALRRVLLSSLEGVAVTEVKIKGVPHEFSTIPGVLEDAIMIILNLKNLRFKIHEGTMQKVNLRVTGDKKVTGADFKLFPQIELANPKAPVATITDKKTELDIEVTIEKGIGYEPRDQRKTKKAEIGTINLDAIFTPIKNVNFQVESMRVGERTDFDKLNLEIETDGTLTPEEAFQQASDILIKHFTLISGGEAVVEEPKEVVAMEEGEVVEEQEEKKEKKAKPAAKKKAKK